jgi:hypothetical protein
MSSEDTETRLFGLGAIASAIRWFTEFLILANILLLMAGSVIAVTNLLTNGALNHLSQGFDLVWAGSQSVAIEVLFMTAFVRAARYGRQGRYGAILGWIVVGLLLAVPTIQASLVYAMTQTLGISTAQALTLLHLPIFTWLLTRSILVAFVGALDGWASYTPEEHRKTVAERVRELDDKAKITEATGRLNQARAKAMVGVAKAAFSNNEDEAEGAEEADGEATDSRPHAATDTGEESGEVPASQSTAGRRGKGERRLYSLAEAKEYRRQRDNGSAQRVVFSFLAKHPDAPLSQIMAATGLGRTAVAKHKRMFFAQQTARAK